MSTDAEKSSSPAGEPLEPQPIAADRTPVLILGDGRQIVMTDPVIFGRRPPAVELVDGRRAIPVGLGDLSEAIEKAHATVRIEAGRVVVSDRATQIGTVLDFADGSSTTLKGASAFIARGTTVRIGPHTIRLDT